MWAKSNNRKQIIRATPKGVGRNSPCPCNSGRKFKNCCLVKGQQLAYDLSKVGEYMEEAQEKLAEVEEVEADDVVLPDLDALEDSDEQK